MSSKRTIISLVTIGILFYLPASNLYEINQSNSEPAIYWTSVNNLVDLLMYNVSSPEEQEQKHFIRNMGQLDDDSIRYYSSEGSLLITDDSIYLIQKEPVVKKTKYLQANNNCTPYLSEDIEDEVIREYRVNKLRYTFPGSKGLYPFGIERYEKYYNFFYGRDPDCWITDVPCFKRVKMENIWPGVDMVYKYCAGRLKYEFILDEGIDPSVVQIRTEGERRIDILSNTSISITTPIGKVIDSELAVSYFDEPSSRIESSFRLIDKDTYGFKLGTHDISRKIMIDPVIWGSYLGGDDYDEVWAVETGPNGNLYMTGCTESDDFLNTTGAYCQEKCYWSWDIFVTKTTPNGQSALYSTFIGGHDEDEGRDIAVDSSGNAYVTGYTESDDDPELTQFPTTPGNISTFNDSDDIVVFKLSSSGNSLLYSTCLGGEDNDRGFGITVDDMGYAYLTGYTDSWGFQTKPSSYMDTCGEYDLPMAFVSKINTDGTGLEYSTFIGTSRHEAGHDIVLDASKNIYVIGRTDSTEFDIRGSAYQSVLKGSYDIFIVKLKADGSDIIYSTYIGGSGNEFYDWRYPVMGIDMDSSGNIIGMGYTLSNDFPNTTGVHDESYNGNGDIVLFKLNPTLSNLIFSTYLGGQDSDLGLGMDIDNSNNIYIAGSTPSIDFPTTERCFRNQSSGMEATISKFSASGSLLYSTFVGGSGDDFGYDIKCVPNDEVILVGKTYLDDFPTTNETIQPQPGDVHAHYSDGFFIRFNFDTPPSAPTNPMIERGYQYLNISWDPPEDSGGRPVTGYKVYRGSEPDSFGFSIELPLFDHYNSTGLKNGKLLYLKVAAINSVGEGTPTDVFGIAPGAPPTPPIDLSHEFGDEYIQIEWNEPLDDGGFKIEGYKVYRGPAEDNLQFIANVTDSMEFNSTGLQNGQSYYLTVSSYNEAGEGRKTGPILCVPMIKPGIPTHPRSASGDDFVNVSWSPPLDNGGSDITGFILHKWEKGTLFPPIEVSPDLLFYNDTSVINGLNYEYRIAAQNGVGRGPFTGSISDRPLGVPTVPRFITYGFGDGYVEISWQEPADTGGSPIVGYNVYRGTHIDQLCSVYQLGTVTTLKDTGLTNGINYYYLICGVNEKGEGLHSAIFNVTPMSLPDEPDDLNLDVGTDWINVSWSEPRNNGGSPIVHFIIEIMTFEGKRTVKVVDRSFFNDTGLIKGVEYNYKVASYNRIGSSGFTEGLTGVPRSIPSIVIDVELLEGDNSITITWSEPKDKGGFDNLSYRVYRDTDPMRMTFYVLVSGAIELIDLEVENGVTYYYRISSVNGMGEGPFSNMVTATPGKNSGEEQFTNTYNIEWDGYDGTGFIQYEVYACFEEKSRLSENSSLITIIRDIEITSFDYRCNKSGRLFYKIRTLTTEGYVDDITGNENSEKQNDDVGSNLPLIIVITTLFLILLIIGILLLLLLIRRKRHDNKRTIDKKEVAETKGPKGTEIIPGYYTVKRIGGGGFSDVYLAKDEWDENVALKLPQTLHSEEEQLKLEKRFVNEAKKWTRINSKPAIRKGIVGIFEYGTDPKPFISMEYVEGGNLRRNMKNLPPEEKIDCIISVGETLHKVHKMNLIHRDIKPENILLDRDDNWKIADWGLSKLLSDSSGTMTQAGQIKGTISYAAPEQINPSKFGRVDKRTDIYQMGVLAYELLTGKKPFVGTPAKIMFDIVTKRPKEPISLKKDIPIDINDMIIKALEKEKKDRPDTIKEFLKPFKDR